MDKTLLIFIACFAAIFIPPLAYEMMKDFKKWRKAMNDMKLAKERIVALRLGGFREIKNYDSRKCFKRKRPRTQ